jgi:enoyl-CoA hydratase/carnithine racemase
MSAVDPSVEPVLYDVRDGVAVVTLNRPHRLNAWTRAMEVAYFDALDRAAADDAVQAIVVTAAGTSFSAGADRDELAEFANGRPVPQRDRALSHPLAIPKPVIAAVSGHCVGIGFVHALMCDLRVVDESTQFRSAFAQLGLVAEHGSSWILSRLVGHGVALDLLLSGRPVGGLEAGRLGLANVVAPTRLPGGAEAAAIEYARGLGRSGSPYSMAVIKRQVYADLERHFAESVADAEVNKDTALESGDFAVAQRHNGAEGPPGFAPLSVSLALVPTRGHHDGLPGAPAPATHHSQEEA